MVTKNKNLYLKILKKKVDASKLDAGFTKRKKLHHISYGMRRSLFQKKKSLFLVPPTAKKKILNQFFNDASIANCIDAYIRKSPQQMPLLSFFFLWTISREISQINCQKHLLKYEREVKYNMVKKEEEHI